MLHSFAGRRILALHPWLSGVHSRSAFLRAVGPLRWSPFRSRNALDGNAVDSHSVKTVYPILKGLADACSTTAMMFACSTCTGDAENSKAVSGVGGGCGLVTHWAGRGTIS
ncbi:uncharacterized protein EI97DRAFT_314196 [Westerdykella ornata]|uniref:Uncharacterized protein n=1 Tax=Westerdykella ornata TaxID=318751 RepID=A0A6A6JLW1_WESOR|nr:uncharacterized protein EI97DRAFT_314196 [Westerdykella ornata]KAF2277234.1 hypothetical protein EI97DRAFT_314196 [Westerdykella ornata]